MDRNESDGAAGGRDEGGGPREDQGLPDGAAGRPAQQAGGRELQNEIEAWETDGAGTGGVGQDGGGSGAVGEGF